jgi:hypothetical protein
MRWKDKLDEESYRRQIVALDKSSKGYRDAEYNLAELLDKQQRWAEEMEIAVDMFNHSETAEDKWRSLSAVSHALSGLGRYDESQKMLDEASMGST